MPPFCFRSYLESADSMFLDRRESHAVHLNPDTELIVTQSLCCAFIDFKQSGEGSCMCAEAQAAYVLPKWLHRGAREQ